MTGASSPTLKGMQVLDMGTGTGVLAILAAKLGAQRPVHAIDVDIVAVNSAKENIYKNRLHNSVTVLHGDSSLVQRSKYDLILANINRNVLTADMPSYSACMKDGAVMFLSGFYTEDVECIKASAAANGLEFVSRKEKQRERTEYPVKPTAELLSGHRPKDEQAESVSLLS